MTKEPNPYHYFVVWIVVSTVFALLMLNSCSATHHLNKAVKKDPTILTEKTSYDTIQITTIDSIPYIINDTIHYRIVEVKKDTVIEFKYRFIDRPISRIEYKMYKDSIGLEKVRAKYQLKLDKLQARLDKRMKNTSIRQENKSRWVVWLLIGMLFSLILNQLIRRII